MRAERLNASRRRGHVVRTVRLCTVNACYLGALTCNLFCVVNNMLDEGMKRVHL